MLSLVSRAMRRGTARWAAGTHPQAVRAARVREIGIWFLELARRVEANEMGPTGLALKCLVQAPDQ